MKYEHTINKLQFCDKGTITVNFMYIFRCNVAIVKKNEIVKDIFK